MADPNSELTIIADRIRQAIDIIVNNMRDELFTGRSTGTPDEVTIARTVQQAQNNIGERRVAGAIARAGREVTGRIRQTYNATIAELGAGIGAPEALAYTLPEEMGYGIDENQLGERAIRLGAGQKGARYTPQERRNLIQQYPQTDDILADKWYKVGDNWEIDPQRLTPQERQALGPAFDDIVDKSPPVTRGRIRREPAIEARDAQLRRNEVEMIWVAAFRNTCRDCLSLAGKIKTLGEWKASGFMPGNGNTRCGENCQCHLAPSRRLEVLFNTDTNGIQERLANGVKLQQKKIDELERIRGKKYSKSTRLQMLGQVRTDRFNPGFEGRESLFIKRVPKRLPKRFKETLGE